MTTQEPELFRVLTEQHRELEDMLEQLAQLHDAEGRASAFRVLEQQLLSHSRAEEKTFYEPLELAGATRDVSIAKREHRDIEEAVAKLEAQGFDDARWSGAVQHLAQTVRHHFEGEESGVFDAARLYLDAEVLDELVESFRAQRRVELALLGGSDDGDELADAQHTCN